MNNEPVNPYKAITNTKIEPTVVSYTHPAKTLTISIVDIDNVVDQFWYSDDAGFHFHYYEFAEAILKKAQEK